MHTFVDRGETWAITDMRRITVYGYVAFFTIVFFSYLPYLKSDLCYIDELTLLAESKRTLLFGEHEHRDFFNFHGGANFYLVSLVWRLLGQTEPGPIKLLTFISITAGGIILTIISRRFTKRFWLSILPALVFAGYLGHTFPFSNHHWFGSVSSIIFFFSLIRFLEKMRARDLYWCGFTAALSLLFIMHEGIINTLVGIFVLFATIRLLPDSERPNWRKLSISYLAGFSTLAVPVLAFYASIGVLGHYFYNTFLWPFANYAKEGNINNRPWAIDLSLWTILDPVLPGRPLYFLSLFAVVALMILPLATMLLGVGLLISRARFINSSESERRDYLVLLSLVALSAGIYATAFSQPTVIKLLWGSVPALVMAVLLADRFVEQLKHLTVWRRALAILFAFVLVTIAIVPVYRFQKIYRGDESELNGAESARSSDYPLIDLINRESGPEDYYFGYKWASVFYYRLNARPATPYTLFFENFLTTEQMRDLFEHLERNRPKFMTFSSEQDMLWLASQNKSFIDFLNKHYSLRGRYGQWFLYQRKD